MADVLAQWSNFNVAMAGASAALAGLVIVAASVSIDKIVRAGTLTARLAAAIATLVLALVASATGLIPAITPLSYGLVIAVAAVELAGSRCMRHGSSCATPTRHSTHALPSRSSAFSR